MSDGKTQHSAVLLKVCPRKNIAGAVLPSVAFWSLFSPASCDDPHGFGEKSPVWGCLEMLWLPMTQRWAGAPGMYWGSIPKGRDFGKSQADVYGNKI